MNKYVLSSGKTTDNIEKYLVDLFELYTKVYPGDIPDASDFGFNYIVSNIKNIDLLSEITSRVNGVISKINNGVRDDSIKLELVSLDIVDESCARVVVKSGSTVSNQIKINFHNKN